MSSIVLLTPLCLPQLTQDIVHGILRERWVDLDNEDKTIWRQWANWDKKRYERDLNIYEDKNPRIVRSMPKMNGDKDNSLYNPKKRKTSGMTEEEIESPPPFAAIPKKRRSRA